MIIPVAARLRQLLSELHNGKQRSAKNYSLLITGHSAGGAIAALLYSHMISTSRETASQLRDLTHKFKRIHCITFGAPPVSLLPLTKPGSEKLKKSLFLSFVNEGDPVTRADKKYVRSLLDLYAKPAPVQSSSGLGGLNIGSQSNTNLISTSSNTNFFQNSTNGPLPNRPSPPLKAQSQNSPPLPARPSAPPPIWRVPESELSNAGRIIVLRSVSRYGHENETASSKSRKKKEDIKERMDQGVIAQTVTDSELRGVIWGDPVCHMMKLYARRIEVLATNAVMGKS